MKCNFEKNKQIAAMASNLLDLDEAEKRAIKEAKETYGDDILDTVFLPKDYNFSKIDAFEESRHRNLQKCKLPFDDELIDSLIKMPKKMINQVFCYIDRGKLIHGAFLVGKQGDKYALFMLKIIKDCQSTDFSDVSIKLNLFVQGKAWLNMLRLDTMGNYHPNYIVNGKVASKQSELTYARPPHMHRYDYLTQVISDEHQYLLAHELPFFDYQKDSVSDRFMFKNFINYFLEYTNADVDLNKLLKNDYHFTEKQPLLSDTNAIKANKIKDLDGVEL